MPLWRGKCDIGPAFLGRESQIRGKGGFHFRKPLDKYYTTWKFIKIHRYIILEFVLFFDKPKFRKWAVVVVILWYITCISPPTLWAWIPLRRGVLDTTLSEKACQWLVSGRWFSADLYL